MKILFCVRHNFYDAPGGAQVQILKTKEYLEKLGVYCDITTTPYDIDYNKYDILHLTDLTWVYDNLIYIEEIKKSNYTGKKVLSTIYWPFDDYAENGVSFSQKILFKLFGINGFEFFKSLAKFIIRREPIYLQGLRGTYIENQKRIIQFVDWLLPNAQSEMDILNDRLGLKLENFSIVNNAIDTTVFDEIKRKNKIKKDESLIVFVARIDPRKNQLNFLKAMMDTQYKIRFIGNAGPNSKKYYDKLKELAKKRGNVEFISHISQEEVFKHMLQAKVHVLTSWIETPGLVSIEAAYADCSIVVSDKGSVKDYFKDYAYYCNPKDILSIRTSVEKALNGENKNYLIEMIRENYTWETTAMQTKKAYELLLNKGK